jgi:hypothetical protein
MATKKAVKKPVKKPTVTKKVPLKTPKTAVVQTSTLVITVLEDCTLSNNQNLSPPHLSASAGGGFPHQVKFKANIEVWVCLPASDFANAPNTPIHIKAGGNAGPYKVKTSAPTGQISFTHSCDGPCAPAKPGGGGDSIIIDA